MGINSFKKIKYLESSEELTAACWGSPVLYVKQNQIKPEQHI